MLPNLKTYIRPRYLFIAFTSLFALSFMFFHLQNARQGNIAVLVDHKSIVDGIHAWEMSQEKLNPEDFSNLLNMKEEVSRKEKEGPSTNNDTNAYKQEMINALKSQFEPFRETGIDLKVFESYEKLPSRVKQSQMLARVTIKQEKVKVEAHTKDVRVGDLEKTLYKLIKMFPEKVPDVDFLVTLHDGLKIEEDPIYKEYSHVLDQLPIFVMSKNSFSPNKHLAIPDLYVLNEKKHEYYFGRAHKASVEHPWEQKKSVAFWRGSSTGQPFIQPFESPHDALRLARFKLSRLSSQFPDLIDTKFTAFVQIGRDKKEFEQFHELGLFTPLPDHLDYKYLVSVALLDISFTISSFSLHHSCSWMRVPWILVSNSLLIKQETFNSQWFYPAMKPYVHYVPVKMDLSDLVEKVEWCKENDEIVKEISKRATEFAMANLKYSDVYEHLLFILKEYSSLLK